MKKVMRTMILGVMWCGLWGCSSTPRYEGTVSTQMTADALVAIRVTPVLDERYGITVGYTGIILEVRNKTGQDVVINWDECFYLQGGAANGGFTLGGAKGDRLRGSDVIFPQETYITTIYPAILLSGTGTLSDPRLGNNKPMPPGENGVVLKLRAGFEEMPRRLVFTVPNR